MRTFILILLIPLLPALTGCVAGKQQYDSYLNTKTEIAKQEAVEEQKRSERWQAMAQSCAGDSDCIKDVAREATLSDAFAALQKSGGGRSGDIQQFQVQAHPATAMVTSLGGTLLSQGIQGAVQIRASDNARDVSISANQLQAATNQAAFGLGAAAVTGVTDAVTGMAGVLPGLVPSINAGGSVYQGPTQIQVGDNAGRDNVRDGSRVGPEINTGPINTGTQNRGGVIGSGQVGNGRQNAPGPFRDIGPQCQGEGCQQVTPPPPPDDPESGD